MGQERRFMAELPKHSSHWHPSAGAVQGQKWSSTVDCTAWGGLSMKRVWIETVLRMGQRWNTMTFIATDHSGKEYEGYWLIPLFLTERWPVLFTKSCRWIPQWWRCWKKGTQHTQHMFSGESKAGGVTEPRISNWVIFFKPGREIYQVEDA